MDLSDHWHHCRCAEHASMKLPKLKNYFVAISPDEYAEFERSRTLEIRPTRLDIVTGQLSGRPYLYLSATPDIADNIVREQYRYGGSVYVLRVSADLIDRSHLRQLDGGTQTWQYDVSLNIPHCGVYKYEVKK